MAEGKQRSQRNGVIELFRFLFCLFVLLFHAQKYFLGEPSLENGIHFSFFSGGAIGVEFFFVVSGFLMAKSAYRVYMSIPASKMSVGTITTRYLWNKIKGLLPYHLIAFTYGYLVYVFTQEYGLADALKCFIDSIPNLTLIMMLGFKGTWPVDVEWYLSVMLFGMLLFYPLLLRYYDIFVHVIGPAIALFLLGYISYTTGCLTGVQVWVGFCYKSLLRGLGELCLGASVFEAVRALDRAKLTTRTRILLTLIECFCLLTILLFVITTCPRSYQIYILFLTTVLIMLAFSSQPYHSTWLMSRSRLVQWLGRFTLPLYLCQVPCRRLVQWIFSGCNPYVQIIYFLIVTVITACFCMILGSFFSKKI